VREREREGEKVRKEMMMVGRRIKVEEKWSETESGGLELNSRTDRRDRESMCSVCACERERAPNR
jgi:hypothetical protein